MPTVFRAGALAVISGSASGVGFAFAQHCRRHGMHLALLDIDQASLDQAAAALGVLTDEPMAKIWTYRVDVADLSAWKPVATDLAGKGAGVDFLMLNAGMSAKPSTAQAWADADYFHRTLATNVFGVVHGLATLLPLVRQSAGPSAVVVTGSKQGITNPPGNPAYNASKAAVKSLAEQLAHDLRTPSSASYAGQVSVHLLVPGWTFTGLSGNRGPVPHAETLATKPRGAWLPSQVAEYAVKKINQGRFYIICPDTDVDEALDAARMTWAVADITEARPALSRWDPGLQDAAAAWIQQDARRRREAQLERQD